MNESASRERQGVIGPGLVVMGRIRGTGDIRVEGVVEGEITLDGDVSLGAGATVVAPVSGHSVEIEGELHGTVSASRDLSVRTGGRVRGDVRACGKALDRRRRGDRRSARDGLRARRARSRPGRIRQGGHAAMIRTSRIPAGVVVEGQVRGQGDLVIAGLVEGTIDVDGHVVVEASGQATALPAPNA